MTGWFARLPIHRKLVTSALGITALALLVALTGLAAFDLWRFRDGAESEARALAEVLAENTAAAVMFADEEAARETLASVRGRAVVTRACIYLPDRSLFAGYQRGAQGCPSTEPGPEVWQGVYGSSPVSRSGRTHGVVVVERALGDLWQRLLVTLLAGLAMLVAAAFAAYLLAQRVHASVSRPIVALAAFARTVDGDPASAPPPPRAAPDELGDLVRAFTEMLARVQRFQAEAQAANDELRRSNQALRLENDERRRVEREREEALAREREANRLKDQFLAAVSHELRTPLNAMMGWAQVLAATDPGEAGRARAAASIIKNARAQSRVIEDLIDVSRIATGKLQLTREPVDLRVVAAAAVESVEPVSLDKGVRLRQVTPAEPCVVSGDRDRLQQVLWNLLSNAIRFTPAGSEVTMTVERAGGEVRATVRDAGVGISPAFLPHVFDRFRQADGSMTREHGGLGLGLAIVKDLTEMHGGRVTAESEGRDRGATFTVILPAHVGAAADGAEDGLAGAGPTVSLAGTTVLVVDDNEDALVLMTTVLRSAGASVDGVLGGEAALAAIERRRVDLLVCDLAMPRTSGFDVLLRLRQLDASRGVLTPAVAVSAHASAQHEAESLAAGFQRHLAKPLDASRLLRAAAEVLGADISR
jgi:signal transduction histidine kinase/CheY-like chemotaxis protein